MEFEANKVMWNILSFLTIFRYKNFHDKGCAVASNKFIAIIQKNRHAVCLFTKKPKMKRSYNFVAKKYMNVDIVMFLSDENLAFIETVVSVTKHGKTVIHEQYLHIYSHSDEVEDKRPMRLESNYLIYHDLYYDEEEDCVYAVGCEKNAPFLHIIDWKNRVR